MAYIQYIYPPKNMIKLLIIAVDIINSDHVTHIFLSILPQSLENNAEFVLGYDLTADLHD